MKNNKTLEVKIKYFNKDIIPVEHIAKGSWIDLRAAKYVTLMAGEHKLIPLGIAMEIPLGYEAIVAPRSSLFKKYGVIQTNSIGVIDGFSVDENGEIIQGSGYCGDNDQWFMSVYATKDTEILMNERICQFRLQEKQPEIRFTEVKKLENADRGGFGSTDRK